MSSRMKNIKRNIMVSSIGQLLTYGTSFGYRTIFIYYLGIEYLGINGLFSTILLVLSLAELGVGATITFNLYKPLAEKDDAKVRVLMAYFASIYKRTGSIIALLGIGISPFLTMFIKGDTEIQHLHWIYFLFLANTVVSYFFSYKRAIFNADQKHYVNEVYERLIMLAKIFLQILILVLTRNYLLTLVVQVFATLITNMIISHKANQQYPQIFSEEAEPMDPQYRKDINKKIGAMFAHKIGSLVVFSTDNIVLSTFVGLYWVGLYSNYLLIINMIEKFIQLLSQSMVASIGNIVVSEKKERAHSAFKQLSLLYFWLNCFASLCLYTLLNPFIAAWLGESYLLDKKVLFMIILNFFLHGLRQNVLSFRNSLGLYWNDRYKSLVEAAINLVISIWLVQSMGVIGVFIGTTISTLSTSIWIEPYILYKEYFKTSVMKYYVQLGGYSLLTLGIGSVVHVLVRFIPIQGWGGFVLQGTLSVAVINGLLLVFFGRTEEFKLLLKKTGIVNYIKNKIL